MTDKQIRSARSSIKHSFFEQTAEERRLSDELSCRESINSCLAYGSIDDFWRKDKTGWRTTSLAEYAIKNLGLERVKEIIEEQLADFAKAKVLYGTGQDAEGGVYNAILWEDDLLCGEVTV